MPLSSPSDTRDAVEYNLDVASLPVVEHRCEVDGLHDADAQDTTQDSWLTLRRRCELCKQRKVCISRFCGDFSQ